MAEPTRTLAFPNAAYMSLLHAHADRNCALSTNALGNRWIVHSYRRDRAAEVLAWIKENQPDHYNETVCPSYISSHVVDVLIREMKYDAIDPVLLALIARAAQSALMMHGWWDKKLTKTQRILLEQALREDSAKRHNQPRNPMAIALGFAQLLAWTDPDPEWRGNPEVIADLRTVLTESL